MRCGFHLANLPHHSLTSIAAPLKEIGYACVAVRVSANWLLQYRNDPSQLIDSFAVLKPGGLEIMLDADGRFLIDPWDAHSPRLTRASESAAREVMLSQCIEFSKHIDCRLVTFSVGCGEPDEDIEVVLKRIAKPITRLIELAAANGVAIGIKPEIGSVIETASHFHRLLQWLPRSVAGNANFGWAADIAVMAKRGELPIGDRLARELNRLVCVYLSDLAAGAAGDMRFGTGDLAIHRIVNALEEMIYQGPLIVRCEGHGDAGLAIAKEAFDVLTGKKVHHL